jgi:hypothetical protein
VDMINVHGRLSIITLIQTRNHLGFLPEVLQDLGRKSKKNWINVYSCVQTAIWKSTMVLRSFRYESPVEKQGELLEALVSERDW